MKPIVRAGRMKPVHSDIRGPLFVEAMKRQKQGIDILKLNTGNPATFGFGCLTASKCVDGTHAGRCRLL